MTVHPETVKKPNSPSNYLVIHSPSTHWPSSHSFSSSIPHELPLPSLHPSLTSHTPPTPPLCQLTPEHGHIVPPFDPLPSLPCRSTQDLRPTASVLVCHRALSCGSVIDGPRRAALTRRAAALAWMVWGSIDYDATCDRGESGLGWWRQGEDKRDQGYGWGAVTKCDEIWFVLYWSWHLARSF